MPFKTVHAAYWLRVKDLFLILVFEGDASDVETVAAETIGAELMSARAQDEFVAAFEAEERQ